MNIQSNAFLEQLLKRLDKMDSQQHKLDRVMERLDTLQNNLERQNRKQNQLDEKLVEITMKLEQLKAVTPVQLQGDQQEIVDQFRIIDSQRESNLITHTTAPSIQRLGNQIDDKLKSIEDRTVETARKCDQLTSLLITIEDNTSKYVVELGSIHTLINSIEGNNMTVERKIDTTMASMISSHTKVNKNLEELTTELKDYIHKTKQEIFAVTDKEATTAEDRIQRPLLTHGNHIFDFYVNNFKTLVRSGNDADSPPWYINEMQMCVTGHVAMSTNGEMKVWLFHWRHARDVELQPRTAKTLKIKATICDIKNQTLTPKEIGEKNIVFTGAVMKSNCGLACLVGVESCYVLLQQGYGEKEGYSHGALLIRYEITVL